MRTYKDKGDRPKRRDWIAQSYSDHLVCIKLAKVRVLIIAVLNGNSG